MSKGLNDTSMIPRPPGILKPVKNQSGVKRDSSQLNGNAQNHFQDNNITPNKNYNASGLSHLSPMAGQNNTMMSGYMSYGQASDNGSARLSNVNTFKYNPPVGNMRKVSPQSGNQTLDVPGSNFQDDGNMMLPSI